MCDFEMNTIIEMIEKTPETVPEYEMSVNPAAFGFCTGMAEERSPFAVIDDLDINDCGRCKAHKNNQNNREKHGKQAGPETGKINIISDEHQIRRGFVGEGFGSGNSALYMADEHMVQLFKQPPAEWDSFMQNNRMVLYSDELLIDITAQIAYRNGTSLPLTRVEFKLLMFLVKHHAMICTRDTLKAMIECIGNHDVEDNTLSKHINRLRRDLKGTGESRQNVKYIKTMIGQGYRWLPEVKVLYISR